MALFWFTSGSSEEESSSSSSSTSSSSTSSGTSSDSSANCNCTVTVTLVPVDQDGCGIEVTGGLAYSIGTQDIDYTLSDPCDCVVEVLINGFPPPVTVEDGEPIDTIIIVKPTCEICSQTIYCNQMQFAGFSQNILRRSKGPVLIVNRRAIVEKINQRLAKLRNFRA